MAFWKSIYPGKVGPCLIWNVVKKMKKMIMSFHTRFIFLNKEKLSGCSAEGEKACLIDFPMTGGRSNIDRSHSVFQFEL